MQNEELRQLATEALSDSKAVDLVSIDVRSLTSITDFMLICTGRSTRHVRTLAESVAKKAKEKNAKFVRVEGDRNSEWVLVDLGDVVVQVMLPDTRAFYGLEELWEPIKEMREQQGK